MSKIITAAITSLVIACPTFAQLQFVVPASYATTPGTAGFLGPLVATPRTYQLLIHEDLLTALVGADITGLAWRIPASASANWPAADTTYASYDVYLSGSVAPKDRSLTFARNVVGPQTLVRSGPLTVTAGSYTFGGSPNEFGPEITLDPWLYAGGHLLVELRHTGSDGASRSVDALSTSTAGYGTLFSGAWQSSYTATTGMQGNFSIIRFTVAEACASPADINCDGVVDVNDLLTVIGAWGPCPVPPTPCPADIAPPGAPDGVVDVNDLLLVVGNWS